MINLFKINLFHIVAGGLEALKQSNFEGLTIAYVHGYAAGPVTLTFLANPTTNTSFSGYTLRDCSSVERCLNDLFTGEFDLLFSVDSILEDRSFLQGVLTQYYRAPFAYNVFEWVSS